MRANAYRRVLKRFPNILTTFQATKDHLASNGLHVQYSDVIHWMIDCVDDGERLADYHPTTGYLRTRRFGNFKNVRMDGVSELLVRLKRVRDAIKIVKQDVKRTKAIEAAKSA